MPLVSNTCIDAFIYMYRKSFEKMNLKYVFQLHFSLVNFVVKTELISKQLSGNSEIITVLYIFSTDVYIIQLVVFKSCSGQGKVPKGSNSVISQDGVMVLMHCTSWQCAWPLYEVIMNSNNKSSSYGPDKRKQWKSNKGQ
jgi:hypothetical protein